MMQDKGVLPKELLKEFQWACSRPTSRAHTTDDDDIKKLMGGESSGPENVEIKNLKFELALNSMEHRFLKEYRQAWPLAAYQLNQDPSSGHGHHSTSEFEMFTLISNLGLIWSDHCERWLSPTEALACQYFPVVPFIHDPALELTTFHIPRDDRNGRHMGPK